VLLYFLHSLALLLLPRLNPQLFRQATVAIPLWLQRVSAVVSLLTMGALVFLQVAGDVGTLQTLDFRERLAQRSLTTLELCLLWSAVGAVLYALGRRQARGRAPAPALEREKEA
jgi:hypothetical protein